MVRFSVRVTTSEWRNCDLITDLGSLMKWKHVQEQAFGILSLFSVLALGLGLQVTPRVRVTASDRERSYVFQVLGSLLKCEHMHNSSFAF